MASLLITEYSSMAMEAVMIGMPVIHYQFPEVPSISPLMPIPKDILSMSGTDLARFARTKTPLPLRLKLYCRQDAATQTVTAPGRRVFYIDRYGEQ